MTVSELRAMLDAMEQAGYGDFDIEFHSEAHDVCSDDGTCCVRIPHSVFKFADSKYEFKFDSYLAQDQYPVKASMLTDNIKIHKIGKTLVTFHQY